MTDNYVEEVNSDKGTEKIPLVKVLKFTMVRH